MSSGYGVPLPEVFEAQKAGSPLGGAVAGTEEFQNVSGHHQRHRVGGKDQERAVQDRQALRTHGNNAGNLAGRPGCLSRLLLIDEADTTDCRPRPRFAPEPSGGPRTYTFKQS